MQGSADFSAILAATRANGPSVIQVRARDTLSVQFHDLFAGSLRRFQAELEAGAIIVSSNPEHESEYCRLPGIRRMGATRPPGSMRRDELRIGQAFWCAGKRWRCTDAGTRVIVAICLEPHEAVTLDAGRHKSGAARARRYVTDDPSWFTGPPYAVVEEVFDEDSIQDCSPGPEER